MGNAKQANQVVPLLASHEWLINFFFNKYV